jgi:hypothetical protein
MVSLSQTTNIILRSNEISVYEKNNVTSRFILPSGSEFISWNNDCILLKIGSDIRTIDHEGNSLSQLNLGHREFIKMSPNEIIIKEDNVLNYYNSKFISLRRIPII